MSELRLRLRPPASLRWPRRTARLRLTILYSGLFLVSGVALLAATYALFEQATKYKAPVLPKVPRTPILENLQVLPKPGGAVRLPLPSGLNRVPGFSQARQDLIQIQYQLSHTKASSLALVGPLGQVQRRLTQAQHQLAAGERQLAQAIHRLVQIGPAQAAQRAADSHQLLVNSGIALAIVALLAVLASWLVAGRMLRPIRTITRTAKRISSTSLHERLALGGPEDELKELGDTLDDLFGRLDSAFESQRHFVANASHELRTPLTAERTLLQVALDDPDTTVAAWRSTAQEVLASNKEQERLIEALLALASSESGVNENEPVDLAATVTATVVDLQPELDRLAIHLDEKTTPAPVHGDPLLIERLVDNLLTNAVRHNIVGGQVEVETGTLRGEAVLKVTNTGPLIPPAEVERLSEPFQRLDRSRIHHNDGHGLGLSIVRAIATAHGARLRVAARDNGGLEVEVSFPADRPVEVPDKVGAR